MPTEADLAQLITHVEARLRRQFGAALTVHAARVLKDWQRNLVVRCELSGHPGESSVIIKQIKADGARGFTDWASLAFLTEHPATAPVAPRFLAGDVEHRFFVMSALPGDGNLDARLRQGTATQVRRLFVTLARRYARLHARTMGREGEYERVRQTLPDATGLGRRQEVAAWRAGLPRAFRWGEAANVPVPPGLETAIEVVAAAYAEPGSFLTFTHGDPAPSNNHISGNHVWLLDFEYGGYRHALYDMTAWHILCPLPEPVVHDIMANYHGELLESGSLAPDPDLFSTGWALMCVYRSLALLSWIPITALETDAPWIEDWSRRTTVLCTLSRLAAITDTFAPLRPLATWAERTLAALQAHWPETTNAGPQWPAFREGCGSGRCPIYPN